MKTARPYIHVNVAMTADGKIDSAARKGAAISSAADLARLDRLRAGTDAVMVGGRTLLAEDPKLTVKSLALRAERQALGLPENPAKVGVVSVADLRLDGSFVTAGPAERLVFTTRRTAPGQISRLETAGVQVFVLGRERVDLAEGMRILHKAGMRRLLVEGGGTLIAQLFELDLVDELTAYLAPRIFGGATAPTLADGPGFRFDQSPRLKLDSVERYDEEGGILIRYTIPRRA